VDHELRVSGPHPKFWRLREPGVGQNRTRALRDMGVRHGLWVAGYFDHAQWARRSTRVWNAALDVHAARERAMLIEDIKKQRA